jgi:predicted nucleic acid-binding protein
VFIERLASDVPVHPVTIEIARLAGRIEGQQAAKGVQIAFEDLLIAVTALHLDYDLATLNVRDSSEYPTSTSSDFSSALTTSPDT